MGNKYADNKGFIHWFRFIMENPFSIDDVPEEHRTQTLYLAAISKTADAFLLNDIPEKFLKDPEFLRKVLVLQPCLAKEVEHQIYINADSENIHDITSDLHKIYHQYNENTASKLKNEPEKYWQITEEIPITDELVINTNPYNKIKYPQLSTQKELTSRKLAYLSQSFFYATVNQ